MFNNLINSIPYLMCRRFAKDKKKVDMFVYNSGIVNNNNATTSNKYTVLVKRDIFLNQNIWSNRNKSLFNQSKPIRVYPDLNIHDFSNSFKTTENLIAPLKNTVINIDEIIDNSTNSKSTDDKEQKSNLLILKKIEQVEKIYKKDNPVVHFIKSTDYIDYNLSSLKNNNNNNNNNNNILFVYSEKSDYKCSNCKSGNVEQLKLEFYKKLKEANYFTTITNQGNKSFNLNVDKLVQCKKCKLIMDKEINQLNNLQKRAQVNLIKGRFYYLPHALLFLIIATNMTFVQFCLYYWTIQVVIFTILLMPLMLLISFLGYMTRILFKK